MFGNNHFLFPSAYFWLCLPLTILLSLLPRYLWKAWKFGFHPDDIDTVRYIQKMDPTRDLSQGQSGIGLAAWKRPASVASYPVSRPESVASFAPGPSTDVRSASRTDMSTGMRSVVHRGFDFSTEENGVAMKRMQTNLSERRQSSRSLASEPNPSPRGRRDTLSHVFTGTVRRKFLRRKGNSKDSPD